MNLPHASLAPVRRLMRRGVPLTCFACGSPILPSDERIRLRGDTVRPSAMRDLPGSESNQLGLAIGLPR